MWCALNNAIGYRAKPSGKNNSSTSRVRIVNSEQECQWASLSWRKYRNIVQSLKMYLISDCCASIKKTLSRIWNEIQKYQIIDNRCNRFQFQFLTFKVFSVEKRKISHFHVDDRRFEWFHWGNVTFSPANHKQQSPLRHRHSSLSRDLFASTNMSIWLKSWNSETSENDKNKTTKKI